MARKEAGMNQRDLTAAVDALNATIGDLEGYINRRAQEVAELVIAAMRVEATAAVQRTAQEFNDERQRLEDLVAELRRHLKTQIKRAERAEAALAGDGDAATRAATLRRKLHAIH
jgi:DNA-binding XRE family transcriptional regulator